MSRIEEALKRARETGPGQAAVPTPVVDTLQEGPVSVPRPEIFQDPWTVAEPETEARRISPAAAPAASPVAVEERRRVPDNGAGAPTSPAAAKAPAAAKTPGEGVATGHPGVGGEPTSDQPAGLAPGLALFQGFDPKVIEKIVGTPDIRPAFVEQYRKLAGVLHHAQLAKNLKVVMVTSAVAGEGKSLTSTNLALTFSESFRRSVLLIDADLRRPVLHETFQVPNITGLGDGLRAGQEQKLTLVQVSPRLTLLTAGRPDPDPMSGLTSDRMRRVIEEAGARFDWVIIDTPPLGLLPDANLLAAMVDTTLLVVRATTTPYPLVRRAVESIGRDRIFGVVLNRAEESAGGYNYHSYYDSYAKGK
jgi:capsular exopolysaccharide synthesis family protein